MWGAKEYLTPGSSLSEYDYIRECVRLEKDVRLCLGESKDASLARTERDDARDAHLTLDDLIPAQGSLPMLSFDNLSILLGKCVCVCSGIVFNETMSYNSIERIKKDDACALSLREGGTSD